LSSHFSSPTETLYSVPDGYGSLAGISSHDSGKNVFDIAFSMGSLRKL
jgi:hypothetical protein